VIGRPSRGARLDTCKAEPAEVQCVDEGLDDPDGVVLGDEVVQVLRKQRALVPVGTRDESLDGEHYAAELPLV